MARIKNSDKLKKEGLITSLLKSESSYVESNYMKHFNNTNDDNNNTNDSKIRDKIKDVRIILSRLGNTITSNYRKKLEKSFMK